MSIFSPKTTDFIHLLREVSSEVSAIARLYGEFVDNFSDIETYAAKAKEIEHRADSKVHTIISELHKTFITPFDREDIYALAHQLDDLVDLIENVIKNVRLYHIEQKRQEMDKFKPLILQAAENLQAAVEFLEMKKTDGIKDHLIKIHQLEDEGDIIFAQGLSDLFKHEKNPIDLIRWKDMLQDLENIMDKFQEVSNIIEGIVVKNT